MHIMIEIVTVLVWTLTTKNCEIYLVDASFSVHLENIFLHISLALKNHCPKYNIGLRSGTSPVCNNKLLTMHMK